MLLKTSAEARTFGNEVVKLLTTQGCNAALTRLNEILCERTPFRLLDLAGGKIAGAEATVVDQLLDAIAAQRSEGGWVVIAAVLRERLSGDLAETLSAARGFIVQADVWYACDTIAERVPGQALVDQFQAALDCLSGWRSDTNFWIRRAAGVAGHFWFKRAHGDTGLENQACRLLEFFSPMLAEGDFEAAKGVGWAFKTCGRYYPALACDWLEEEWLMKRRVPAAVIRRKALLYLPDEMKKKFAKA
jgi:hypothetical protein